MRQPRFQHFASVTTGCLALTLVTVASAPQSRVVVFPAMARSEPEQLVRLGRQLFRDKSLSNPPGLACVSCHAPESGYSYPNGAINKFVGTVPGAVKGRGGNRRPPSLAYAAFLPTGVPHYDTNAIAWVGGLFWDGRTPSAERQVVEPMFNPNEMNNRAGGKPSPEMVARKIMASTSAPLFAEVFGKDVFKRAATEICALAAKAIASYERSPEVSPFTSKYDAYLEGKAQLTPDELNGMRLVTGTLNGRPNGLPFKKSAHCADCHSLSKDLSKAPDIFTNSCFANLGVPPNPQNLFYNMTDKASNPEGFNPSGPDYVDLGMGAFLYEHYGWPKRTAHGPDPLRILGTFKAPSLRNVDKRPRPSFVKAYMHNGVFKSLKEVVHFYNTRNLTTQEGEVIDFTRPDPYADLKGKPLWPRPEYLDATTLINPTGMGAGPGSRTPTMTNPGGLPDLDAMQIGNLLLSEKQEWAIVSFLKCLSDGYFERPAPPRPEQKKKATR
ncbi:MAG: cytochrome C [Armatimonadetes bacterium]|nr:cytochrome C [Armatimonadota bacterium]